MSEAIRGYNPRCRRHLEDALAGEGRPVFEAPLAKGVADFERLVRVKGEGEGEEGG